MARRVSYRKIRKRDPKWKKYLPHIIAPAIVGIGFFICAYIVFGSRAFDPSEIKIEGAVRVKAEEIQALTKPFFEEKHLLFFSGNAYAFDQKAARARILEFFPKLSDVSFHTAIRSRVVTVRVVERNIAYAVWCGLPGGVAVCYNVDEDAVAFEEALPSQGTLLLTVKNERDQDVRQLGETVVDAVLLRQLVAMRDSLRDSKFAAIGSVVLRLPDEVVAESLEGWRVIFVDSRPLSQQIVALKEVLSTQIPQDKRARLDYIDLRIEERAYYKYR